ncbi:MULTISPECIES: HPr family phosphocarrier protein [Gammaproteobacteria]|uniref:HPr family phosphocarrier protein n=1 Tax=Gammaproteobacteria TaxID=1236 RepID=UPI000DD0C3D4|nr:MULTISPECIES: HPr family phosphocarrier protein [Gammaproteobacteria]RTE86356.1 HPr family phosphocarrier protein [Aliidiomarina sp. B3213]TCZ91706.1 HPr family phosphocarrier protein [Lysobacter sp. N42]
MAKLDRVMTIRNKLGLHARAATKLAKLSNQFEATVTIEQNGQKVDASSVMGLMLLASQQGKDINVTAEGNDAEAALDAIEQLIQDRFDEEA